ncbi:hypothetical protein RUM44_002197 [Polyplax serrata]|uniref:Uncharacterized protein n=1 Tax=Polyplax serrata TaxID=468196 RepID=A0ABR1AM98_POLSC
MVDEGERERCKVGVTGGLQTNDTSITNVTTRQTCDISSENTVEPVGHHHLTLIGGICFLEFWVDVRDDFAWTFNSTTVAVALTLS